MIDIELSVERTHIGYIKESIIISEFLDDPVPAVLVANEIYSEKTGKSTYPPLLHFGLGQCGSGTRGVALRSPCMIAS